MILRDIAEGKPAPLQMAAPEHDRWARSRLLVLGVLALVALSRLLWIGRPTLMRDEAYYWEWSRRLGLGYFDHPPLVALVIRATTALGGASEFAVRVGMVALGVGTVALAYRVGALLERRSSNRPGAHWERFGRPPNAQTGRLRRPNGAVKHSLGASY